MGLIWFSNAYSDQLEAATFTEEVERILGRFQACLESDRPGLHCEHRAFA
jgi:hypothetical protein